MDLGFSVDKLSYSNSIVHLGGLLRRLGARAGASEVLTGVCWADLEVWVVDFVGVDMVDEVMRRARITDCKA
jgi:hypothetical protein